LIAVYDAEGRELAAADDGYFSDPVLTFKVPKDGEYRLVVRDATYAGDPRWAYALLVTDKPYAMLSFPLGVNPGQTLRAEPVGSAAGMTPGSANWTITAPQAPGIHTAPLRLMGSETNPVPVVVSTLPTVAEVEPNDTPKDATRVKVPCGINGRIGA